jgi:hypothetical protein
MKQSTQIPVLPKNKEEKPRYRSIKYVNERHSFKTFKKVSEDILMTFNKEVFLNKDNHRR